MSGRLGGVCNYTGKEILCEGGKKSKVRQDCAV